MNELCTIHHLNATYRLPESLLPVTRRLDAILKEALSSLEAAFQHAGLLDGRIICIRRIHVPVRFKLGSTDTSLAISWSLAISQALRRMVDTAVSSESVPPSSSEAVVMYPNRLRAMVDAVNRVLQGDFHRTWAWRALGIWTAGSSALPPAEALHAVVAALVKEPELVVPVFRLLADVRRLPALFVRLTTAQWTELAKAVLNGAHVDPPGVLLLELESYALPPEVAKRLERLLARSVIAPALPASLRPSAELAGAAVLLIADAEPGLLVAARSALAAHIAAIRDALKLNREGATPLSFTASSFAVPSTTGPLLSSTAPSVLHTRKVVDLASSQPGEPRAIAAGADALTAYGGLLFLLRLLEELGLPQLLMSEFPARGLQWTLHRLALTLLPLAPGDPAALAFCGLLPNALPPDRDQEPLTAAELDLIGVFCQQVMSGLAGRLITEPPRSDAELLRFVCRRPGRIIADPGWFEVHFSFETVSTEIRRAGLDLDPDWLPWLGAVVRFVYE